MPVVSRPHGIPARDQRCRGRSAVEHVAAGASAALQEETTFPPIVCRQRDTEVCCFPSCGIGNDRSGDETVLGRAVAKMPGGDLSHFMVRSRGPGHCRVEIRDVLD